MYCSDALDLKMLVSMPFEARNAGQCNRHTTEMEVEDPESVLLYCLLAYGQRKSLQEEGHREPFILVSVMQCQQQGHTKVQVLAT